MRTGLTLLFSILVSGCTDAEVNEIAFDFVLRGETEYPIDLEALLIFGPLGSPQDFEVKRNVPEDFGLGEDLWNQRYRLIPQGVATPGTRVRFGTGSFALSRSVERWTQNLYVPIQQDGAGLKLMDIPEWRIDMKQLDSWTIGLMERSGFFGLYDTKVEIDIERVAHPSGTVDIRVILDSVLASQLSVDRVLLEVDGETADLGALSPNRQQRLEHTFEDIVGGQLAIRLENIGGAFIDGVASAATRLGLVVELEPPGPRSALEEYLFGTGKANEGIVSLPRDKGIQIFPNQLDPEDTGAVVSGEFGTELLKLRLRDRAATVIDSFSRPPAQGTTNYGGAVIGVKPRSAYGRGGPSLQQTPPVVAALMSWGDWGLSIANYDNTLKAFGASSIVDAANITDLSPVAGDFFSGAAIYVDNSGDQIKFIGRDAQDQYVIEPSRTITNSAWPNASGRVVSAVQKADGSILFITDGEPGELWLLAAGAQVATKVGLTADGPRQVRCAGNIAAVGCFGGFSFGGLSLFVKTGASWGPAPASIIGQRSVGIDAKQLPNGKVAIASTQFFGDKFRITVLNDTTGAIEVDKVLDPPQGLTGPGHIAFVRETGIDAVLVSGNTSDNIAFVPVTFE